MIENERRLRWQRRLRRQWQMIESAPQLRTRRRRMIENERWQRRMIQSASQLRTRRRQMIENEWRQRQRRQMIESAPQLGTRRRRMIKNERRLTWQLRWMIESAPQLRRRIDTTLPLRRMIESAELPGHSRKSQRRPGMHNDCSMTMCKTVTMMRRMLLTAIR